MSSLEAPAATRAPLPEARTPPSARRRRQHIAVSPTVPTGKAAAARARPREARAGRRRAPSAGRDKVARATIAFAEVAITAQRA
jgi:hypothetical protein